MLLQQARALLDERYQPDGYNVGWNSGAVGGQEVFHAHLHVIPRFRDEPLAGQGIRHALSRPRTAARPVERNLNQPSPRSQQRMHMIQLPHRKGGRSCVDLPVETLMRDPQSSSWLQQLIGILPWQTEQAQAPVVAPSQIIELAVPTEQRRSEDWRDLLQVGRRVHVAWVADGERPGADPSLVRLAAPDELTVPGEVRLDANDSFWVWFDCDVPRDRCPEVGQALQVLVSYPDGLRVVPCRVIEQSHGGSLQLTVNGRISRVQRREDVRTRVDLPPLSAIRLGADDAALGLVGVRLLNLSAGGVRFQTHEPPGPSSACVSSCGWTTARR